MNDRNRRRLGLMPVIRGATPPPIRAHAAVMVGLVILAAIGAGAIGVACGTSIVQPAAVRWSPCPR